MIDEWRNKVICTDALDGLRKLPDASVDCVITSPPYWALRDYGESVSSVWDAKDGCEHDWGVSDSVKKIERKESVGGWERPSRKASALVGSSFKCVVCGDDFNGKHGQKFCSTKCLNTLSNEERQGAKPVQTFCQKCGAWRGQLGLEPSFDLFIKHLCDVFDDVKRVLKKSGSVWVNLGDTYGSGTGEGGTLLGRDKRQENKVWGSKPLKGFQKCLVGVPERFMLEMINRGWILRNKIVWHKPNCMPSSAKDRFTVDYENIYLFVKSKKYYFEQQKEKAITGSSASFNLRVRDVKRGYASKSDQYKASKKEVEQYHGQNIKHGEQRNMRCVWTISTKPFAHAHFAVFPEELVEPMVKSGCPEKVCNSCRKPREKVFKYNKIYSSKNVGGKSQETCGLEFGKRFKDRYNTVPNHIGFSDCGCNTGFNKGVVLDLFGGSGTVGVVAKKLGRDYLLFDLSEEYCTMARKRLDNRLGVKEGDLREVFS